MCDGMVAFQPTAPSFSASIASSWPARRLAAAALLLLFALLPRAHASGKTNTHKHTHNGCVHAALFSSPAPSQSKLDRLGRCCFSSDSLAGGFDETDFFYAWLRRVALPPSSSREIIPARSAKSIHRPNESQQPSASIEQRRGRDNVCCGHFAVTRF